MSQGDGTFGPIPGDWIQPYDPPYETVVDGETRLVRQRTDELGVYDFDWVSGPNANYGFTSASSDRSGLTTSEMDDAIRNFLAEIDPATGYLAER